jgi:hypothetical protein
MKNTKVKLSQREMELVTDRSFILTKNAVIEKVYELFGQLSEKYKVLLQEPSAGIPEEVLKVSPKIYKGERYLHLPYVMLDYPRYFSKENVCAIRTFFWWGNYFSISLQLAGKYQEQYLENIINNSKNPKLSGWHFYKGDDPWQYQFVEEENTSLNLLSKEQRLTLSNRTFIKISKILSLQLWEDADMFFSKGFSDILFMVTDQFPRR